MVLSVDRLPATTFCGVLNKCPATNLVAANAALRCDRDIVAANVVVALQVTSKVRKIAGSDFERCFTCWQQTRLSSCHRRLPSRNAPPHLPSNIIICGLKLHGPITFFGPFRSVVEAGN